MADVVREADALRKRLQDQEAIICVGYRTAVEPFVYRLLAAIAATPQPAEGAGVTEAEALLKVVEETVQEAALCGDGFWRTCSGCYEGVDGQNVNGFPYYPAFGCVLGGGCRECGGIGALWDTTDYAAMADDMMRDDARQQHAPPREPSAEMIEAGRNAFYGAHDGGSFLEYLPDMYRAMWDAAPTLSPNAAGVREAALREAADLVRAWNGATRDGDTFHIADAIIALATGSGRGA